MGGKVFFFQSLTWAIILLGQIHGYKGCIQKERKALLELKKYIISQSRDGESEYVLPTWTNDTKSDCCQWEGVKCNSTSRRLIKLSIGQQDLKENSLLNLSLLHPFEDVQSLDFSQIQWSSFYGLFDDVEGYQSLKRLRKLEVLDLSLNAFNNSIYPFLNAATSLKTLFLRDNYMDGHFPTKELKDLTNLELLDLSRNVFNGSIPVRELSFMRKLKALDLSSNEFSGSVRLQELKNLTNLEVLRLGWNSFKGDVLIEDFCEMKNLRELDLSGSYFGGLLPSCLGSLNKLRVLDLSSNELSGNLPSSFSALESLEYVSLLENNFTGLLSLDPLANLTKLKVFQLSSTSDMVQVETQGTWRPKFQLSVAALPFCSLKKIPNFLTYQKNLRLVDLSSNMLSGTIPTWLLGNNPQLEVLKLKSNSFTIFELPTLLVHKLLVLDFSANDMGGVLPDNIGYVLPSLVHINGSDNVFQGNFPSSMGELKNLSFLDLSYNNLSGNLPRSFVTGCFSLQILKLSHNKFSGHFLPRRTSFTSLSVLRINNNSFTGRIGLGLLSSTELSIIDMSHNRLTGAIPSWISEFVLLDYLLLSNNFLEGTIPPSLLVIPYLSFLDLSANLLSGALPSQIRSMHGVKLFLQDNSFTGPISSSLSRSVTILDLRNNKLSGSIPGFVNTGELSVLLLKGNNLTGAVPEKLCDLSSISLLDLSDNKLNGFIPSCLYNLSFGLGGDMEGGPYIAGVSSVASFQLEFYKSTFVVVKFVLEYSTFMEIEIKFSAKQRYDSYTGRSEFSDGVLDYMYGMDLSSNELSGVIPAELGELSKLRALNLSRNFLLGPIPDSFSKLEDIESLDLSYNMLQGRIPHQLTNLTSLAVFNVSHNNLSGVIPQGRQFNTFKENSYLGNPLLCGSPTHTSCEAKSSEEADKGEEEDREDKTVIDMPVFYWSSASTYVTTLISILVLMCFDCPWRRAWFRLVDTLIVAAKRMLP